MTTGFFNVPSKLRSRHTILAMMLTTMLVTLLVLVGASAKADILFLDLNNSVNEVETARRAAARRGEKLIVLPSHPPAVVAKINDRKRVSIQLEREAERTCRTQSQEACKKAEERHAEAVSAFMKQKSEIEKFNDKSLKRSLEQLKQAKVSVSSVVISGHDGNGRFTGLFGDLSDRDIAAAFAENAPLDSGVRSLLLWGCYTTNLGSLEYNWKGLFPNANVIIGFTDKAPVDASRLSLPFLEDALIKEKKLSSVRDEKALHELVKGINGMANLTANVCLNGETIATPQRVYKIKDSQADCDRGMNAQLARQYDCFFKGELECPDVPADTGSSPLRDIYGVLQRTAHCRAVASLFQVSRPNPEQVIRLIYDREVRKNFENQHRAQLEDLNRLLKELGMPERPWLKGLGKVSRSEFLQGLHELKSHVAARLLPVQLDEDLQVAPEEPKLRAVSEAIPVLQRLADLDPQCIPFEWVESGATGEADCALKQTLSDIKKEGARAAIVMRYENLDNEAIFEARQKDVAYQKVVQGSVKRPRTGVLSFALDPLRDAKLAVEKRVAIDRVRFYQQELAAAMAGDEPEGRLSELRKRLQDWQRRAAH